MLRRLSITPVLATALIMGCAPKSAVKTEVDPVYIALENAAQSIEKELVLISERQQARHPNQEAVVGTNDALNRTVEIFDFGGSVEDALTDISELIGYKFTNNRSNSFPVTVLIQKRDVALLDIVRSIGAQAGASVDVIVDERYREIRLEDK